jgi:hypothetical protein
VTATESIVPWAGAAAVDSAAPTRWILEQTVALTTIASPRRAAAGSDIRRAGSDHAAGRQRGRPGNPSDADALAVFASIGHDQPRVVPRARVGVPSTGDDVERSVPEPSGIAPVLIALLDASGELPVDPRALRLPPGEPRGACRRHSRSRSIAGAVTSRQRRRFIVQMMNSTVVPGSLSGLRLQRRIDR